MPPYIRAHLGLMYELYISLLYFVLKFNFYLEDGDNYFSQKTKLLVRGM